MTDSPVKVELVLVSGKTAYHMGEPIKLTLSFSAPDGADYQLDATTKLASPIDGIIVAPDQKVFYWLDIHSGTNWYSLDYSAITNLLTAPSKMEFYLND